MYCLAAAHRTPVGDLMHMLLHTWGLMPPPLLLLLLLATSH
jgi:hypothetical protein